MKKNTGILEEAYEKAKQVLKICSTPNGLYASGCKSGYKGVWARDSMISLIGASSAVKNDNNFVKEQFEKSLITLAKYQGEHGEISNAVMKFGSKKLKVDYISIDSSLWFIIG